MSFESGGNRGNLRDSCLMDLNLQRALVVTIASWPLEE